MNRLLQLAELGQSVWLDYIRRSLVPSGELAQLVKDDGLSGALQAIRHRVRDARRVATCLGFGPRFQHSTGQA